MTERLVVIGGDAAGMSAASQARRLRGPDELEIVAFERGQFTSYAACGIPYWIGGLVEERDALIARTPEVFRDRQGIDVRIRHEVTGIDTDARTVRVTDLGTGQEAVHDYDQLLVATGATPVRPPVPGIDAAGVLGVQTLVDGQRVLDALEERSPRRAVVIGAGYIGLEMAEAMCLRDIEVHVVEMAPRPMSTMDPEFGDQIAEAMQGMGMHLHLGVAVEAVETGDDGFVRAVQTSEGTIEADLVVLGTGARPLTELAEPAGIPIGPSGGIVTDRRQRTPVDRVWAAGDCTETFHRISRRPVAIALGTIANKQGRIAGLNLGGAYGAFPGVLGTAVTKVCHLEIARTGLGEQEAMDAGFAVATSVIEASTRAGYYPGAKPLTIKTIAEQVTGRLLGAQIVGEEGAAKRIDVFATALWNEMTVGDLLNVDLAYAPPFSPVWDPVLIAARQAEGAVQDASP
ncbi:MAG: flavoprotein oxidoreductase [Nitriliruptor sp.]|nr:MAG: flavoprotein oxidoreductase [Nitriliruptor sp.]